MTGPVINPPSTSRLAPTVGPDLARNARLLLAAACIVWFVLLCFVASLTPNAFVVDETGYLLPILYGFNAENYQRWSIVAAYPSYLYFWVYSLLPSDGLHAAAKILNAGFIAATAIPAYAVARRYLAIPFAAAFAAVVMLSPISSFVRYVMPEPMYFFGFWLVVAVVLSILDKSPLLSATAGGALIGALSLVKPHALALTVGVGVFFLLRDRLRLRGVIAAAALLLAYYGVRVVLGYALTGKCLWSVMGSLYSGMIVGRIDLSATAYNLAGHVCAIVTLIAVPLAVTLVMLGREALVPASKAGPRTMDPLSDLGLLACCILAAMLLMTVYFTQSVYHIHPETERITRLHGRYYFYALPLFGLVTLGLWQQGTDVAKLIPRMAVVILCCATIVAATTIFLAFEAHPVDFPDLGLLDRRHLHFAAVFLPVAALCLSGYGLARVGTKNLILGASLWWPVVALSTSAALIGIAPFTSAFGQRGVDVAFFDPRDPAGLRRLIGRGDGIVIGSPTSAYDVQRTMFYLRSLSAGRIVPSGSEISDADLPEETRWAVILPGVNYAGSSHETYKGALVIVWK